ncbi:hypothetical protein [Cobetia marina]|uniref:hypothetical protein n=1 Tax=Cobetia marina TaxID=28258 RepID=UPI001476EB59|nr:hypothetical protein [Cobetia marina]
MSQVSEGGNDTPDQAGPMAGGSSMGTPHQHPPAGRYVDDETGCVGRLGQR